VTAIPTADRALLAAEVMSAPAVSVTPETSVWRAWSLMSETGLRHLVVAVDERCVGVVDDRTVFAQWPNGPLALRRRCVGQIMRVPTACVLPGTDMREVARVMLREAVDNVPVIDTNGSLVGIVTRTDVVAAVAGS